MSEVKQFTKSDWMLFQKKIPQWQENYMERLNKEYIQILSQENVMPSEKFWALDKRIKDDKRKKGVLISMRKSNLIDDVLELLIDEVITMEDLKDFSDVFNETIQNRRM